MDTKNADQNLLLALLALKMGLIDNEAMVAALNAWSERKDRSIGRVLVERHALAESRLFLVEATFTELLDAGGGDPRTALVSLRVPAGLVEANLDRIADTDLRAALSEIGDQEATGRESEAVGLLTTEFDPRLDAAALRSWVSRVDPHETRVDSPNPELPPGREAPGDPATKTPAATRAPFALETVAGPAGGWPSSPATDLVSGPGLDPGCDLATANLYATRPLSAGPATLVSRPSSTLEATVDVLDPAPHGVAGPAETIAFDPSPSLSGGRGAARGDTATGHEPRSSVRYRSLRPHAKGGLGEVFVAIDEELGREVALKEIQARHADRADSRARFLIEAEVTGGLEHPGIVPVYGLGQYPDGRPYYAMRFIRGGTLKEAIDTYHDEGKYRDHGRRTLELRALLNRLIDVCNALGYAHTRGILHRDIKPANIMLGRFGETLVVDWGLAKTVDRPETPGMSDLGLLRPLSAAQSGGATLYGTTVGTPNFMSPEQAAGDHDRLGPPSDVYSLGATLYCILAGRPPFHESQLGLLLEKVRQGKFPPPREVNRQVPAALEAVCLKAMAREPEDRYPSALALADDLEHWLADEPVSAYREPWTARLARWARRHRTIVATTTALALTALVALSVGNVLIRREQARTEANFRLARDAVDQMLTRLGEVELADVPQMEPVRRTMLGKALEFYSRFLAERGGDRSLRSETGRANIRLGDIEEMLGDYEASEQAYLRAIELLGRLASERPGAADDRRDLAAARHRVGVLLKKSNRLTEAEAQLRDARQIRRQLVAAAPGDPDARRDEMDTVYQLGAVLARLGGGRVKEVEAAYAEAVDAERTLVAAHPEAPDYPRKLGRYLNNRGILLRSTRPDPAPAEAAFREALDMQKPLSEKSPTVAGLQWERARTTSNLAAALERSQGVEHAVPVYRESLARLKQLADDFPSVPDYQNELAVVSFNLGSALTRQAGHEAGRDPEAVARLTSEAEGRFDDAVAIYGRLIRPDRSPHRPDFRQRLAQADCRRGILRDNTGRREQGAACFREAIEALEELVARYPKVPEYRSDLGLALQNLAANRSVERPGESRGLLDAAIAHQRVALAENARNPIYRQFVLDAYSDLEKILRRLGDHAGAQDAADALASVLPDEPRAGFRAAHLLDLSATLAAAAADLPAARRDELARARSARALERLRGAVKDGAHLVPRGALDAPAFDAIRKYSPDALEALRKALQALADPKVG